MEERIAFRWTKKYASFKDFFTKYCMDKKEEFLIIIYLFEENIIYTSSFYCNQEERGIFKLKGILWQEEEGELYHLIYYNNTETCVYNYNTNYLFTDPFLFDKYSDKYQKFSEILQDFFIEIPIEK